MCLLEQEKYLEFVITTNYSHAQYIFFLLVLFFRLFNIWLIAGIPNANVFPNHTKSQQKPSHYYLKNCNDLSNFKNINQMYFTWASFRNTDKITHM